MVIPGAQSPDTCTALMSACTYSTLSRQTCLLQQSLPMRVFPLRFSLRFPEKVPEPSGLPFANLVIPLHRRSVLFDEDVVNFVATILYSHQLPGRGFSSCH